MTLLTVVPAIHQQCVAVLSQLHNWDSKKAKCWNTETPLPSMLNIPLRLSNYKLPNHLCHNVWSSEVLWSPSSWSWDVHGIVWFPEPFQKGTNFACDLHPPGFWVRGTSTIQESPHFWRVHECQTLWGPFSQLIIVYKICGTTETARANAFAANPTFASIGSRISFDMLKSLRRASVFLLYKT